MTGLEKQSIASPTKFPTKSTLSMQRICVMLWFPIRGTVCDDSPIPHYPRQVSREAECVPTMLLSSPQCDLLTLHNVTLELHVAVLRSTLRYFSIAVLHRSALLFCSARWTLRVQCCERPRAPADQMMRSLYLAAPQFCVGKCKSDWQVTTTSGAVLIIRSSLVGLTHGRQESH